MFMSLSLSYIVSLYEQNVVTKYGLFVATMHTKLQITKFSKDQQTIHTQSINFQ